MHLGWHAEETVVMQTCWLSVRHRSNTLTVCVLPQGQHFIVYVHCQICDDWKGEQTG